MTQNKNMFHLIFYLILQSRQITPDLFAGNQQKIFLKKLPFLSAFIYNVRH